MSIHLVELRRSTASNLLSAQLHELGLQVIELLLKLLLVLSPERRGLDFAGRLRAQLLVCIFGALTRRHVVERCRRTILTDVPVG